VAGGREDAATGRPGRRSGIRFVSQETCRSLVRGMYIPDHE